MATELTADAIEQIAQRVAELLREDGEPSVATAGLVDAGQLARHLGVTRAWVYQHAEELGAIRIGKGPKARLRFDLQTARDVLAEEAASPRRRPVPSGARPRHFPGDPVPLLPITPRRVRGVVSRLRGGRRIRGR